MRIRLVAVTLLLLAGCGGSDSTSLPQGSERAKLDAEDFVARVDHPYWPMRPGSRWVYREDGARITATVTDTTKEVLGIRATVVHDVVSEDGEVVEDTYDWYGQDKDGNLWYLGEDTKELAKGKVKSTKGSWEAGVDGAEAGVILPAEPKVGMRYRQEYYKGEAEDAGEILSLDERVEVPFGRFDDVVKTKDYTPLEPDVVENKYYAKGVGPVLAVTVSGGSGREELIRFKPGRG
jgi:major membrane immunogen (membrane-anchored lipoprotein)